ncbi:hypothetical protein LTR66_015272, partial [Elasticomyces elasticus]
MGMIWEERYIMLLWLSHLMLAPFDLATISLVDSEAEDISLDLMQLELPSVAHTLLKRAFHHLLVPSKDREAASMLIVRLSLRGDMQKLSLPQALVSWTINELRACMQAEAIDHYKM